MTSMMERNLPRIEESPNPARFSRRQMQWIKSEQAEAWTCLECAWTFRPSGPPVGDSLDEMMLNFELKRDGEFASHHCSAHPKVKATIGNSKFSEQSDNPRHGPDRIGRPGRNNLIGGV